jgi:4-amino-4-deoxy-L-arabinose transferase-like glycosyltransferase
MTPPETTLRKHAVAIVLAATALRLLLAASLPLVADEAYYWEWSRHLAFGYFDHPPVIAWLIAYGTALFGDTALGVRLFPVLCGAVAAFALIDLSERLAGAAAARFASLLLAVTPFTVGFVLATPDAPLLAALAMTLALLVRAVDPVSTRTASLTAWANAGVAIGIAMASKFTAVLLPMAATLAIVVHPVLRTQLKRPGPYLAVVVASLVMLPVLHWNATHDWIAFRFQLGHGLGSTPRGSWWQRELDLLGGQAALVTPILFALLVGAIHRAMTPKHEARRFLLAFSAVFCLGFFVYSATRKSVEANWPAIGWLPALALLAAGSAAARTVWERRAVWLSGVLTAIVLVHVAWPFLPIAPRRDPANRLYGWSAMAAGAERAASEAGITGAYLGTTRYQDAALLAWYSDSHPHVSAINLTGRRNQYDLWPRFTDVAIPGAAMVLVLPDTGAAPEIIEALRPHFAGTTRGALITVEHRGQPVTYRRTWTLSSWRGTWPDDPNDPLARP